ncbi:hypothetical protein Ahy_B05g075747 [Arachis hypogaea]|uniref:Uncharacterized protein n=1 Tax=Arachis hypogaea TaxID=3818 RepID=A0A444Z1X7_ARAHY|nr:hypothetical protein Ahy_B05g075747 [Arachis hypogaea]
MASASNAAKSSNNPRLFGSIMRRMNRNKDLRLPEWCGCGSRPVQRQILIQGDRSWTVGKRWCGLFLWVDKLLEEDVIICDGRASPSIDNEEWKMKIAWKLGRLESEVMVLIVGGVLMFVFMLLITVDVLLLKLDRQFGQLYLAKNK